MQIKYTIEFSSKCPHNVITDGCESCRWLESFREDVEASELEDDIVPYIDFKLTILETI